MNLRRYILVCLLALCLPVSQALGLSCALHCGAMQGAATPSRAVKSSAMSGMSCCSHGHESQPACPAAVQHLQHSDSSMLAETNAAVFSPAILLVVATLLQFSLRSVDLGTPVPAGRQAGKRENALRVRADVSLHSVLQRV